MEYKFVEESKGNAFLLLIPTAAMDINVIIPFKPSNPKSRLSSILSHDERLLLAEAMLRDVYEAVSGVKNPEDVTIISPEPFQREWFEGRVLVDERSLDECVNSAIVECRDAELAVIMSDLPLLNPQVLQEFFSTDGDVVAAPGRKGGTNMLLVRDSRFRVSYHFGSFFRHRRTAESMGLKFTLFDSYLSSIDIDEPSDILELMLHGIGKHSHRFLSSLGFYVDFSTKDPVLRRYMRER